MNEISASALITTSRIFRFSPLRISVTSPLTGDVILLDGFSLS